MSAYSEKLRDPRWQKKRLLILERDGWKCLNCQRAEKTLHVHHLIYSKGEPWDAPDATLETLCDECHAWREEFNDFVGGRTVTPTVLCYCFMRLSGHRMPKDSKHPAMSLFVYFAGHVCPHHLPKQWRPTEEEKAVDNRISERGRA